MKLTPFLTARRAVIKYALEDYGLQKNFDLISIKEAEGRVSFAPIKALRTLPPADMSAMDGYAVRSEDTILGTRLKVIGNAPAGNPYAGTVSRGQAVRLFTGSQLPKGADHILIQEDVMREGGQIRVISKQNPPRHIRPAGQDFQKGQIILPESEVISASALSLLAAAGQTEIEVHRRPKIAIFSTGDELADIGEPAGDDSIIASTPLTLMAWCKAWGGDPSYLGIARDNIDSLSAMLTKAAGADVIIPIGGASVGEYDLVKTAFETAGYQPIFSKVALRPGKPVWFGKWQKSAVLGLPGNPASSLVCARLFIRPLIKTMTGQTVGAEPDYVAARLDTDLPANGARNHFRRAHAKISDQGQLVVTPQNRQDSSLIGVFTRSNCLIHQSANTGALEKGALAQILYL